MPPTCRASPKLAREPRSCGTSSWPGTAPSSPKARCPRGRRRSSRWPSPTPSSAPTASTPTVTAALEQGSNDEQMTEAVHVAAAIRGGSSLVHGVQMRNHRRAAGHVVSVLPTLQKQRHPLASGGSAAPAASRAYALPRGFEEALEHRGPLPPRGHRHRSAAGQRRQALQSDLPPLSRGRRPRPHARSCRPTSWTPVSASSRRAASRRSTSPAARPSCTPTSVAWSRRRRAGPPRDGSLQSDGHPAAQLPPRARVSRGARGRGGRLAPVFPGADRPMRSEATACSRRRSRRCGSSTRSVTACPAVGLVLDLVTNPVGAFLPPPRPRSSATGGAS